MTGAARKLSDVPHAAPTAELEAVDAAVAARREAMLKVLTDLLKIPSVSGAEAGVAEYCAAWGKSMGMDVDLFETDESALSQFPESRLRHLPLAGRPTCVLKVRGTTPGARSLLLNAHTDVVPAGDESAWQHPPFAAHARQHPADREAKPGLTPGTPNLRVFGRGACDDKGPLVSGLWAMAALAQQPPEGDVLIELIPGEEDCVGLGSLTSLVRGHRADALVVLEPTEGEPTCASRSGLRFEVTTTGRSVHGTVKWLGVDAITIASAVLETLRQLELQYNDREADPLFAKYPFARPLTVDTVRGGQWQGMVADRCSVAGYFDLLPADDLTQWMTRLEQDLVAGVSSRLRAAGWKTAPDQVATMLTVSFPERYTGHRLSPDHALCRATSLALAGTRPAEDAGWRGFNSGCEAGFRQRLEGTPTLVWGPGSLEQAHAADEYVDFTEVESVAQQLARLSVIWCRK